MMIMMMSTRWLVQPDFDLTHTPVNKKLVMYLTCSPQLQFFIVSCTYVPVQFLWWGIGYRIFGGCNNNFL